MVITRMIFRLVVYDDYNEIREIEDEGGLNIRNVEKVLFEMYLKFNWKEF